MGVVYASINVSEASRATVYPGELTFTPDNWADPKVGRPLQCPLPCPPATSHSPAIHAAPAIKREVLKLSPGYFTYFLPRSKVRLQMSCT